MRLHGEDRGGRSSHGGRDTLEQDIDEVLVALAAAGASPRKIDWEPTPEPVQAFEDMRDLPEEPEDSDEDESDYEGGSGGAEDNE